MSIARIYNANGNNDNNINFTVKDTKSYVPVVTLSARDNQKLLPKDLKDQLTGMNIKQKVIIKIQQTNLDFFLNRIFFGVNRLFVLVYRNQDAASKIFKAIRYYLLKGVIDNNNVTINGKNFYDQPMDSDIKRFEEIRKLTAGIGEDYTTGCFIRLLLLYEKSL